jgi:hypothetical protein
VCGSVCVVSMVRGVVVVVRVMYGVCVWWLCVLCCVVCVVWCVL